MSSYIAYMDPMGNVINQQVKSSDWEYDPFSDALTGTHIDGCWICFIRRTIAWKTNMFIKMAIEIVDLPISSSDLPSCFVCLPIVIWVDLAAMIIQHIQLFGARWLRCRTTVVDSAKSHQSSVKHLIQLLHMTDPWCWYICQYMLT